MLLPATPLLTSLVRTLGTEGEEEVISSTCLEKKGVHVLQREPTLGLQGSYLFPEGKNFRGGS